MTRARQAGFLSSPLPQRAPPPRAHPPGDRSDARRDDMLTILGFGMVMTFMYLIMSKRLSPLVALTVVPIVFALVGGFHAGLGPMMRDGIRKIAPTGIMLMFAILYFGVMIDAGLFDPIVDRILRAAGGDPLKVVVGSALLPAPLS